MFFLIKMGEGSIVYILQKYSLVDSHKFIVINQ